MITYQTCSASGKKVLYNIKPRHMKRIFSLLLVSVISLANAQTSDLDTLVDIGGYNMHFYIIKGNGTPILFEAGAGNDGSVWNNILKPLHDITGTTLITYDRTGFGKSEINPHHTSDEQYGIINGINELERGLKKLGYFEELILVSHSYGGFYTTLFSSRNPGKVLYNVRVDANLAGQYTDEILIKAEQDNSVQEMKGINLGSYYLGINFANTVKLMRNVEYPNSVPAIDIVSPIQRHQTDDEWKLLIKTHQDFIDANPNRTGIVAYGSGHYIFLDNPGLIINSIVKAYLHTISNEKEKTAVLQKALDVSIDQFVSAKHEEYESRITDIYAIRQGIAFMKSSELKKAEKILRLNTELFPESSQAFEYYSRVLDKLGNTDKAINMLMKSIELDPNNENAKRNLRRLKK